MNKIGQWLKNNKEILITVAILLTLFFIVFSILFTTNKTVISDYKGQLEENRKEKLEYQKRITQLNDSISFWENQAQLAINQDTVFIIKIRNQKTKINEELNNIADMSDSTSLELHTRLSEQYIQTGFAPDSIN